MFLHDLSSKMIKFQPVCRKRAAFSILPRACSMSSVQTTSLLRMMTMTSLLPQNVKLSKSEKVSFYSTHSSLKYLLQVKCFGLFLQRSERNPLLSGSYRSHPGKKRYSNQIKQRRDGDSSPFDLCKDIQTLDHCLPP